MTTWEEVSEVEQHVLDSASEDTQLWELEAPRTIVRRDAGGGTQRRELTPAPARREHQAVLGDLETWGSAPGPRPSRRRSRRSSAGSPRAA